MAWSTGGSGACIVLQRCPQFELRWGSIVPSHPSAMDQSLLKDHSFLVWGHFCVCMCVCVCVCLCVGRWNWCGINCKPLTVHTAIEIWVHQPIKESGWVNNSTHSKSTISIYVWITSDKLVTICMPLTLPSMLWLCSALHLPRSNFPERSWLHHWVDTLMLLLHAGHCRQPTIFTETTTQMLECSSGIFSFMTLLWVPLY